MLCERFASHESARRGALCTTPPFCLTARAYEEELTALCSHLIYRRMLAVVRRKTMLCDEGCPCRHAQPIRKAANSQGNIRNVQYDMQHGRSELTESK